MIFRKDAKDKRYMTTKYSSSNYKRLISFFDAVDVAEEKYFRFASDGYEPFVVENLEYSFVGYPVYSIAHYYDMNGDAMRDPEMTVMVDRIHGHLIPLSYRQDNAPFTRYGVLEQDVFVDEDARRYRPHIASELDSFLNMWSKNILEQGFSPEQAQSESSPFSLDDFASTFA